MLFSIINKINNIVNLTNYEIKIEFEIEIIFYWDIKINFNQVIIANNIFLTN